MSTSILDWKDGESAIYFNMFNWVNFTSFSRKTPAILNLAAHNFPPSNTHVIEHSLSSAGKKRSTSKYENYKNIPSVPSSAASSNQTHSAHVGKWLKYPAKHLKNARDMPGTVQQPVEGPFFVWLRTSWTSLISKHGWSATLLCRWIETWEWMKLKSIQVHST